jgi:single-strand DNA-binding protein
MNKWTGIGRLTKEPDVRYSNKNGEQMCIARYTLAVPRKASKEADYISCVAFGKQGEFVEKYLKKGMKIAVAGKIQTGSYEKDGKKIYTTDIVVEEHEFVESKKESQEETPASEGFIDIPEGIENTLPFK